MLDAYELPRELNVEGVNYAIRTDYRVILDILRHLANPEYDVNTKVEIMLRILFVDWDTIPTQDIAAASARAAEFIDMGLGRGATNAPRLVDWEQDAQLIIPPINRAMSTDVRALPYMHWWTFLGAYMDIGDCLFSQIVHIRSKKAKGQKLEKSEQEFYRANKALIVLRRKETDEERRKKDSLLAKLDRK